MAKSMSNIQKVQDVVWDIKRNNDYWRQRKGNRSKYRYCNSRRICIKCQKTKLPMNAQIKICDECLKNETRGDK